MPVFPRRWTDDELRSARNVSEKRFILERQGEGPTAFHLMYRQVEPIVRGVLQSTNNLHEVNAAALIREPRLWQALRYFCAPPISEEDLWTLVGNKFKTVKPAFAAATADAFASVLDSIRFPWLQANSEPTVEQLESAVMSTTFLLAHETLKTARRGSASEAQEAEVSRALLAINVTLDARRSAIVRLDELDRGSFSRERKVGGAKCDIPIRLADGRLLAVECKVSNGPKNSWKRLQREVGGKSERWKQEYGSQVVTAALLAGVFDLRCLIVAQNEQDVFLFWQHDLHDLTAFITTIKG
jgi:hypothetical protein